MKKYFFELKVEQMVYADTEDEAWRALTSMGAFEGLEFELVNIEDDTPPVETGAKVLDLMAALKESLAREDKNVSR